MSIRALRPDDLPAVAALYADFVGWDRTASERGLVAWFTRMLFDDPFADPEIPALVYEDPQDGVVAVIGSRVRRYRDRDRELRLACSGPLIAHADHRRSGIGGLLLRRYLAGPQELTFNDRAIDEVHAMWTRLGGVAHTSASIGWARVVAPAGAVAGMLARRVSGRDQPPGAELLARVDAFAGRRLAPAPQRGAREPLTEAALIELLERLRRAVPLRPAYDETYLAWLFAELEAAWDGCTLVRRLVRADDGRPLGAYVIVVERHGFAHVLQVAAAGDDVEPVLDHLMHDAAAHGAVEVRGRFEPHLLPALRSWRCRVIGADWTLLHSRDATLLGSALSDRALLSRLDGEWAMLPHTRTPARAVSAADRSAGPSGARSARAAAHA